MTYSEKLKDPRWQRKRLEILEAAHWKCQSCANEGNNALHVHHEFYMKGAEPWEAPDGTLIALCDPCHVEREEIKQALKLTMGRLCGRLNNNTLRDFAAALIHSIVPQ